MMTRREIFNKVKNHLLMQGKKSYINAESTVCAYRSDSGDKCAAGCLIDDEHYSASLEKQIVGQELVDHALRLSGVDRKDLEFVRDLQIIHDRKAPTEWETSLNRCAEDHHLQKVAQEYGLVG